MISARPALSGSYGKPATPRGRLLRKYVVVLVALVSAVLLLGGSAQSYFTYRDSRAELTRIQRFQALAAAAQIEQLLAAIFPPINGTIAEANATGAADPLILREEYRRLLRQDSAVDAVRHLDALGREQVFVSRVELDQIGSRQDFSQDAGFLAAKAGQIYVGPLRLRANAAPSVPVALPEGSPLNGVMLADVSLASTWDEVATRARPSKTGYAYIVNSQGGLLAHSDATLALSGVDFSGLSQVRALRGLVPGASTPPFTGEAHDLHGRSVLFTRAAVVPPGRWVFPGWWVFVEQPLSDLYAPLYAALLRSALILIVGLVLAVIASVLLARRMVRPIRALRAGALRIGGGDLNTIVAVRTGDELETLSDALNQMSARLRESYAGLERTVARRTEELTAALARLEAQRGELERANQHKSAFLAQMSHELRTPLNAVNGFSEVLLERMFGELNEKQDEYLHDILSSGQHLLALINDILDLAKVEAGGMELEVEPLALRPLLESGLSVVRERAARHGIALTLELGDGVDLVEADPLRLKQAVFNLLANAVKFTPDGGRVRLSAEIDGETVRIAVQDTGSGIAAGDLGRIFEEFQQAGATPGTEGTGLGLALTRRFVELHGGHVEVESEPGAGSRFTIVLPRRQSQAAHPVASAAGG